MGFKSMLAERAKQWPQQWLEEGRKEGRILGRREGRQEGMRDGQARQLALMLEQKFGALPQHLRLQLDYADAKTLMNWAGQVLVANELKHVFNDHLAVADPVEDLVEVKRLLEELPLPWIEQGRKEGRKAGRKVGRREGVREGQARQLALLLEQKFGAVPEEIRLRLDSADTKNLIKWAGRVLAADELGHVFNGRCAKG